MTLSSSSLSTPPTSSSEGSNQTMTYSTSSTATATIAPLPSWLQSLVDQDTTIYPNRDIPLPTANGGYTHTTASKAKIAAANRGKVPWNKGQARSEETKARIAEGVRKRNRENFLRKLAALNMTEDQYNEQQAQILANQQAEKMARKTQQGGYRLTEETKQKISNVLKTKWANGQVKRKSIHPSKVRRGFVHSEETRAKISEALRKRWATDTDYRAAMLNKTADSNTRIDVRQRISESLKRKWEDPVFRANMTAKISARQRPTTVSHGMSHREKISAAIRAKWKDETYRQRATEAMLKRAAEKSKERPPRVKTPRPHPIPHMIHSNKDGNNMDDNGARFAQPLSASKQKKIKGATTTLSSSAATTTTDDAASITVAISTETPTLAKPKVKGVAKAKTMAIALPTPTTAPASAAAADDDTTDNEPKAAKKKRTREKAGSVNRLREERRDLYDLLYGDEDEDDHVSHGHRDSLPSNPNGAPRKLTSIFFEDEDLDDFDPYGLEDD